MKSVYIETTVVGNIAGRIHPNPLMAARQAVTRNWWSTALDRYDIFASELVVDECNAGDPTAAAERLLVLNGIRLIQSSSATESICRDCGFEPPSLCTPEQLLEAYDDS